MYSGTPGFENAETSQQWPAQGQPQTMLPVQVPLQQQTPLATSFDDGEGDNARRPPNAFILYSQAMRTQVRQENPTLSNTEVSSLLGKMWKDVPNDLKLQYKQQAQKLQESFKKNHPDYTYRKARRKRALNELLTKSQYNYPNGEAFPIGQQYPVGYPFAMGMMPISPQQTLATPGLAPQLQPSAIPTQQIPTQGMAIPQQIPPAQAQGIPQMYQNVPFQQKPEQ